MIFLHPNFPAFHAWKMGLYEGLLRGKNSFAGTDHDVCFRQTSVDPGNVMKVPCPLQPDFRDLLRGATGSKSVISKRAYFAKTNILEGV